MDDFAPALVLIVLALVVGSVFRSRHVNRRLAERTRAFVDLQSKLIDRFGDATEVVRYLESGSLERLLDGRADGATAPRTRILDAVQTGILVLLGGIGLLAGAGVEDRGVQEVMTSLGILGILLGIGFLVSAAVTWALLRSWGLVGPASGAPDVE